MNGTTVRELPLSQDLLQFYRRKLDEYENERLEMIKLVDDYSINHKRQLELEEELRKRVDEIEKLQDALRNSQKCIFNEREHTLELQQENDSLRIQELEDRRKIKDLLALTQPIEQEVMYLKECRPEKLSKPLMTPELMHPLGKIDQSQRKTPQKKRRASISIPKVNSPAHQLVPSEKPMYMEDHAISSQRPKTPISNHLTTNTTQSPSRVMRTIFMPNEKIDTLLLQIESLKANLDEQKRLSKDMSETFEKEKDLLQQEIRMRQQIDSTTIQRLQHELDVKLNLLHTTTREHILMSQKKDSEIKDQSELIQVLKQENEKLQIQLDELKKQYKKEAQSVLLSAKEQSEELVKHFRDQVVDKEKEVLYLKEQLEISKKESQSKLENMNQQLKAAQKNVKEVNQRRAIDLQGFTSEVGILQKTVKKLETKLYNVISLQIPLKDAPEGYKQYATEVEEELKQIKKKLRDVEKQILEKK